MDEDVKAIINQVFSVNDAEVVERMIDLVNKDMSDSNRAKRLNGIEYILNDALK